MAPALAQQRGWCRPRAGVGAEEPPRRWRRVLVSAGEVSAGSGGTTSCALGVAAGRARRGGGLPGPLTLVRTAGSALHQARPGGSGRPGGGTGHAGVPHALHPWPWRASAAIAHSLLEVAASGGQGGAGVGGGGQARGSLGPRVRPQHPNQGVQATVDSLRSCVALATHRA